MGGGVAGMIFIKSSWSPHLPTTLAYAIMDYPSDVQGSEF